MDITPLNVRYEDVQEASGAVSGMVTGTVIGATASATRRTARESPETVRKSRSVCLRRSSVAALFIIGLHMMLGVTNSF